MAAYRGPVGVEIAVQGRGLTKYDAITIGGEKTATRYLSENELRFTIPALPSGVDYPVQLIGGPHGALDIGNFRIDESILSVVPNTLEIQSGDTATLLFKIDFEALKVVSQLILRQMFRHRLSCLKRLSIRETKRLMFQFEEVNLAKAN